jgi:hypothetical protein
VKSYYKSAALVLALIIPLELFLSSSWYHYLGTEIREYTQEFKHVQGSVQGVIVGDSHPHRSLKASRAEGEQHVALPPTLADISYESESLFEIYVKLQTLIAEGHKPQYLVMQVDDHIFSAYRLVTNNEQDALYIAPLPLYNAVYGRSVSELKKEAVMLYPLADLQNRNMTVLLLIENFFKRGEQRRAASESETVWVNHTAAERQRIGVERVASQFPANQPLSPKLIETYRNIIGLCRKEGIRVVGVRYPLSDEFRAAVQTVDLSAAQRVFASAPPDTTLDYSALVLGHPELYFDSDHLNTAGSAQFVPRFIADLQRAIQPAAIGRR